MTHDAFSAQDIADFLQAQPDFFEQHADIFANLSVPHPHQARAISLGERQILTLRTRAKEQEMRLAQILHNARSNERINAAMMQWCARMLAEADATQLPAHIIRSLSDLFDIQSIALRLWDLPLLADSEFAQDVTDPVRDYAQSLTTPYCGPLDGQQAASWLGMPPASLAILALRTQPGHPAIGLLVLGSEDPERFAANMGIAFLDTIAELAGASLHRLAVQPVQSVELS
ncbi:DUF484 family protein [Alcaligenaceae bacterium CGII-47]|nr:DUF484 family protein [Alcaligenaceae bacterium CGII-47]